MKTKTQKEALISIRKPLLYSFELSGLREALWNIGTNRPLRNFVSPVTSLQNI